MSSMRNAVQNRNYKERAQPLERGKWGLLEKHKDYSLRARDYSAKKARLKILRTKAKERNPDEFHYGMLSSTSKGGKRLADRGNPVLSHDTVKLLKTQDSGYLRVMIQKTRSQIDRLQEEFVLKPKAGALEAETLATGSEQSRKVVFVESSSDQKGPHNPTELETEGEAEKKDVGSDDDDAASKRPKPRRQSRREEQARADHLAWKKRQKKEQTMRRAKLLALENRAKELGIAENELETQRAKMSNAIGGINKAGVKFKIRERNR